VLHADNVGGGAYRFNITQAGSIGPRADGRHARVRPDAHGDQALRHLLAEPDADVVPLGDDVGRAVVDGELHPDVRVGRQESLQGGPEDRFGRVLVGRDADGAGGLLAELAERGQRGSISSICGPTVRSRRSPASVGATLSVVRARSLSPSAAMSPRMMRLSADCETPSREAARVKLRSRATARKARRSSRSVRGIRESGP
jgi:hypothetical protein